jgi:hypothetical protein
VNGGQDRSGGHIRGEPAKGRLALYEARTGKLLRRWDDSGIGTSRFEEMAFSPDGRLLASSDVNAVHLWEVATAREVCTLRGHRGEIESLSLAANGRRLVSSSRDSTVLVWDLPLALHGPDHKVSAPTDNDLARWWAGLAGDDARRAYAAIWGLAEAPAASVPFLERKSKPAGDDQANEIRRQVADLDSDAFAVREKAFKQLESLGPVAEVELRRILEKNPSPEVRRRVESLLEKLSDWARRAVAALEYAATPEARRLLQKLAEDTSATCLAREAKSACERLSRRAAP